MDKTIEQIIKQVTRQIILEENKDKQVPSQYNISKNEYLTKIISSTSKHRLRSKFIPIVMRTYAKQEALSFASFAEHHADGHLTLPQLWAMYQDTFTQ